MNSKFNGGNKTKGYEGKETRDRRGLSKEIGDPIR